jgi:hypothetical protein|tara:strand:- start:126 stop:353 length:228 start_codon:yes stop_codon:yes gene_type:complete
LSIVDQKPSKYSIGVYENMVRYTVIAQHDGLNMEGFDFKTNKDRMTEWMGDLRQKQYGQIRTSPNLAAELKAKLL